MRYVRLLRQEYNIPYTKPTRQYQEVEELLMGYRGNNLSHEKGNWFKTATTCGITVLKLQNFTRKPLEVLVKHQKPQD